MAYASIFLDFQTAVTIANTYGQMKTCPPIVPHVSLELTNLPMRLVCDTAGEGLYLRFFIRKNPDISHPDTGNKVAEYVRPLDSSLTIAPAVMELLGITGENSQADDSVIDVNLQACYLMAFEGANLLISENGLAEELAALPNGYGLSIQQEGEQLKCSIVGGESLPDFAILEETGGGESSDATAEDSAKERLNLAMALLKPTDGAEPEVAQGLPILTQLAQEGNAQAQWELGLIYLEGILVPQDVEKGAAWIARSAENGYELAQETLNAVAAESAPKGEELISLAEGGDIAAMIQLGGAYCQGTDEIGKDPVKGISWLEKAANMTANADLEYQLAMLLMEYEELDDSFHGKGLNYLKASGSHGNDGAMRTFRFLSYADALKASEVVSCDAGFEEIMQIIQERAVQGDADALQICPIADRE